MIKLVALASLLVAVSLVTVEAKKLKEREGHQNNMLKRLGHFNERPFIDLYKYYAAVFVWPNNKERDADDYRNYRPSGDECMIFLQGLRVNDYYVQDFDKFVLLDACLGYLFADDYQEYDFENSELVKEYLKPLKADTKLASLWNGTEIETAGPAIKSCVADLLLNVIAAKHQYPSVVCNNLYLQIFLQFAECQEGKVSVEQRQKDTYFEYIYRLLKDRVEVCVHTEIKHIERAVRLAYERPFRSTYNRILALFLNLRKQSKGRMWPYEVTKLLSAVQNTTHEVNQREVHQLIYGVVENQEKLKQVLLDNIAWYANKMIRPRTGSKEDNLDPTGANRYTDLIDSLCNFFRTSDHESINDYATPIIRLVQLLSHEDLFGITKDQFIKSVLTQAKESAPIYMSVMACNILTYTNGLLRETSGNSKKKYLVSFNPDTRGMVLWPTAGYL